MPVFYIVATPIGNLKDISLRAIDALKEVDLILCEDTRMTQKLLERYEIKKPLLSYHQHSELQKIDYIIKILKAGKNLALVSDAGTPGISDPGNKLIEELGKNKIEDLKIIPIPGPSALISAISISGFPMDRFLFLGFPPAKNKRKKFFEEVINSKYPVIFYESPYRILKTLKELCKTHLTYNCSHGYNCTASEVVVCRELTKKFETIYRGEISEVIEKIEKDKILGEFTVIVKNK
ncbi:MAG: 16S rRNA (cytidine(1402)-2'-O)-methyltransferase [Candidatus Pacebacteria bacterium]|nr:16S rRNA (cytidine(1402)-2'-O)-methyltransferase [Candidatus Paceibacterota bacterium]